MKGSIWKNKKISIISFVVTLLIWQILAMVVGWELKLPSPASTAKEIYEILFSGKFYVDIGYTLMRATVGFCITLIIGTICGFLAGLSSFVEELFKPTTTFIKSVPTIGLILFIVIWMDSHYAPILIGGVIVFPIVYNNILHGIRDVDCMLIEMGQVYKFSKWKMVREIYFPSVKEFLYSSIMTGAGLNLKVVIAGEVLGGAKNSIGMNLQIARVQVDTVKVLAWIIIVAGLVMIVDNLIKKFKFKFIR